MVKLLGKLATKLWAHINCRPDHDKSGKIHSDKHGRNDGLTASGSQLRGREQSSLDSGSERHIIQVGYQNQDSATVTVSDPGELASQAIHNVSSASDKSLKVSDPPEDRDDDKNPPPYRLRPDKVTSSQAQVQPISFASLAKICLIASAQVGLAGVIWFNSGTSLSASPKFSRTGRSFSVLLDFFLAWVLILYSVAAELLYW